MLLAVDLPFIVLSDGPLDWHVLALFFHAFDLSTDTISLSIMSILMILLLVVL